MKTRLLIIILLAFSITVPVTSFAEQSIQTKENFQTGIIKWSSRCYSPSEIAHVTSFCGQFQGKLYWYFVGEIKDSQVIHFGLDTNEKPKLCAIKDNPQNFTFNKSAIVRN